MFSKVAPFFVLLSALISQVHGHGAITGVQGANGVQAQAFGIVDSTPRDGTKRNPFQQDSSIIRQKEIDSGDAGPCGRTLAGGNNDVTAQLQAADSAGLPSCAADGSVKMTLHQVNGDGAGPYTCGVSTDASGANFQQMQVTTQVPGKNSNSRAKATDFPLVAQMPAGATCTGGPSGNACLVRCMNAARAGPFGGCVAVTNNEPAAAAGGNATAAAAPAAAAPAKAAPAKAAPAKQAARDVSLEEADAALADDIYKRRVLQSRIIGEAKAGKWI